MKLWNYLKKYMIQYSDRIALYASGITYGQLILLSRGPKGKSMMRLCEGNTNEALALEVLRGIAKGQTVIPLSKNYGVRAYEKAKAKMKTYGQVCDDIALVMFTSGTSGDPKGVMLTDENIICCLENMLGYFDMENMQRICISRSLIHISALVGELLYGLINGMTIYFYEKKLLPSMLSRYLWEHKIDVFCATPTVYGMLAKYTKGGLPLQIGAISGERLTESTALLLAKAFPQVQFYNVYGLTEHSPRVSALLPKDFIKKPGSVGKPIGNVKMRIKDGELLVRSPCIMKGYLGEKRCGRIRHGWLYTGDIAHCDEDGYYYIDGRKDDMIIRAGVNLFPYEIEEVIKEYPGVEECLVYAIEDDRFGQKLCALIKGVVDIPLLCKYAASNLPAHLLPNEYTLVSKIEYTQSGKKQRSRYANT